MNSRRSLLSLRFVLALSLAGLVTFAIGCKRPARNMEIVSRTLLTGSVNGSPVIDRVEATINIGRDGHTTCRFDQLPAGFTPATLGTHA